MKTTTWFNLQNTPEGIPLTVTFEGTGSGTARILPNGLIVVDLAAAQHTKYVNLSTPYAMKVIDAWSIHGNATSSLWAIANTTDDVISDVTAAASDKDIDRAADVDDAYDDFAVGDDDLRIDIATAAFTGRIIIAVQFT